MSSLASRSGFRRIFKEALSAYAFDLGGIVAGIIIASRLDVFTSAEAPWSIFVYPAVLSARGIIGGLFSGRLSTALHLGTIFPRLFGNTESFRTLLASVITLALEVSLIMSIFSVALTGLLWRSGFSDLLGIFTVVSATMALGLSIAIITAEVSFVSYRRGLDPDVFLYPVVSAVSDVLITLFYAFVLVLFSSSTNLNRLVIHALVFSLVLLALFSVVKNHGKRDFTRTLRESFMTLVFVAIFVNITGLVLNEISVRARTTMSVPLRNRVFMVFPAVIAVIGDIGAVVGSTATTKLAMGLLGASYSDIQQHSREIIYAWVPSLLVFVLFSFLPFSIQGTFLLHDFLQFSVLLILTNLLGTSAIILISYAVAILTFQRGLDPDNFVIPIESVLADSITTISLFAVLGLAGLI